MTLKTILVAVGPTDADRIDRIAEATVEVAEPTGATVVLSHVFSEEEYGSVSGRPEFAADPDETTPDEVAKRHSPIRELADDLSAAGVEYEIRGRVGERAQNVVELTTTVGADRVIIEERRRRPTGKAVFGSAAQEVLLTAPCPVTLVQIDA